MKRGKGYQGDSDDDYLAEEPLGRPNGGSARQARRTLVAQTPRSAGRSRPTNNQLLYKAYFRWNHYCHKLRNGSSHLPTETDACPSVTAAFLQVLHTLNLAEGCRVDEQRNILQLLSNNTRRTKVVELSTGTHRVPDELRKHYLSDGEGGQYSTNLDRNRYGNDDQYLFTVIRYDLEFLGLCPCMVDVEIIDAKNDNQSIFVSAGPEACCCSSKMPGMMDAGFAMQQFVSRSRGGGNLPLSGSAPDVMAAAAAAAGNFARGPDSPKRSNSNVSQLFDALVMAATGGTEGAAAAAAGGEAPVESRLGGGLGTSAHQQQQQALASASLSQAAAAAMAAVTAGRGSHQLPARQRSRLWSALSFGDMDSLQNALDAFRAEDEIASGPQLSDALAAGAVAAGPTTSESFRRRQRKPVRGPSSNMLAQMEVAAGIDSNVIHSLMRSANGAGSGLRERSGDHLPPGEAADVISSGAVQDGHARRATSSGGPGRSIGSGGNRSGLPCPPRTTRPEGLDMEQLSQEDDSEPVTGRGGTGGTGGTSGGRRSGSGKEAAEATGGRAADSEGPADHEEDDHEDDDEDQRFDATGCLQHMDGRLPEGVADAGGENIPDADPLGDGAMCGVTGDDDDLDLRQPGAGRGGLLAQQRRVRHVPRQSSAINLATRMGPAEMKRMAAELASLRAHNRMLQQQLAQQQQQQQQHGEEEYGDGSGGGRMAVLEREVAALRQQVADLIRAKRAAEEKAVQLSQELTQTRNTANQVLQRLLTPNPSGAVPNGQYGGVASQQGGASLNPMAALNSPAAVAAAAMQAAAAAAAAASGRQQQQQQALQQLFVNGRSSSAADCLDQNGVQGSGAAAAAVAGRQHTPDGLEQLPALPAAASLNGGDCNNRGVSSSHKSGMFGPNAVSFGPVSMNAAASALVVEHTADCKAEQDVGLLGGVAQAGDLNIEQAMQSAMLAAMAGGGKISAKQEPLDNAAAAADLSAAEAEAAAAAAMMAVAAAGNGSSGPGAVSLSSLMQESVM